MEIFADVRINDPNHGCNKCKFLFSTFSYGHDVYHCNYYSSGPALMFVGKDGVEIIVVQNGDRVENKNRVKFKDPEYVRQVMAHAMITGVIPPIWQHWIRSHEVYPL